MKKIARYSAALLIALITALQAEAYTLQVKGQPEEQLKAMNDGIRSFNCWGDVGNNHYYTEELVKGIEVEAGQTVVLYANGQYHFEVEKWVVDGQDQGNGQLLNQDELTRSIRFTMPAHDCQVEAWMKYVPAAPDEPNAQPENYRLKVESEQLEHLHIEFFIIKNSEYGSNTSIYNKDFAWTKPVNPNTDIYGNYPEVGVYPGDSVAVYVKTGSNGWRFSRLEENGQPVWEGQMQYYYDFDAAQYVVKLYTFVMPRHDVTLQAFATFDPDAPGKEDNQSEDDTPGNPGSNRWTASTGEVFINNTAKGRYGGVYGQSFGNMVNELRADYGFEWSDVKRLTIVGDLSRGAERQSGWRMYDYVIDLSLTSYSNLEVLDLRNATHLSMLSTDYDGTFVDQSGTRVTDDMLSRISEWDAQLPSLKKLLLPACLKGFYRDWNNNSYIFDQLPGLQELTLYAVTPPKVDGNMLDAIVDRVTLYVPEQSLAAYTSDPKWGQIKSIKPISDDDAQTVTVSLPYDHTDKRYANMTLSLLNLLTGEEKNYVVDERPAYSYYSIPQGAHVMAQLRTTSNVILAQTDTVIIGKQQLTLEFKTLRKLHNLQLKVLTIGETDVTQQVSVNWFDSKGALLGNTPYLDKQMEGTAVYYSVKLPTVLASRYLQPARKEVFVGKGDDLIAEQLLLIDSVTISGVVRSAEGERLAATVSVSQQVNGIIGKSFVTTADASGRYSLRALSGDLLLSVSLPGYVSERKELSLTAGAVADTITLQPLRGPVIDYQLTYTESTSEDGIGTQQEPQPYSDYDNVAIAAYNETTGRQLDNLSVQYPQLVLLDGAKVGDRITLTATSLKNAFMPTKVTVSIGSDETATATLPLVELGGIEASFTQTDNTAVNALLYDNEGRLLDVYPFSQATQTIAGLEDGQYTLVMMADNTLYGKLATLGEYTTVGLAQGTDYVSNDVSVVSGIYKKVHADRVPTFDEHQRYFTDDNNTSLMLNKSEVSAGSNVTLRSQIAFKDEYKGKVSNVRLVVDIPACGEVVEGSAMTGTRIVSDATLRDGRITIPIPLDDLDQVTRFIITTVDEGTLRPQAYAQFTIDGREVLQPIGTVSCDVKGITIYAPEMTNNLQDVFLKGTAPALSYVRLYADDMEVGRVRAQSDGTWNSHVELPQYPNLANIRMHAVITTPRGIDVATKKSTMIYDRDYVCVKHVYMTYPFAGTINYKEGGVIDFDFENPEALDDVHYACYVHSPNPFNFSVEFNTTDSTKVSDVTVLAYTVRGDVYYLPCTFDSKTKTWVGSVKLKDDGVNNVDVTFLAQNNNSKIDADLLNINLNLLTAISDHIDSFRQKISSLLDVMGSASSPNERLAALDEILDLIGYDPSVDAVDVPADMTLEQAFAYAEKTIADLQLTDDMMSGMSLYNADLGSGITVKHTTGLTTAQLLIEGYQEIETTDGHKIYVLTLEGRSVFVDFQHDVCIEWQGDAAAAARLRDGWDIASTVTSFVGEMAKWQAKFQLGVDILKGNADKIRLWIIPAIMEIKKAITYINTTYRYAGAPPLTMAQKASLSTLKVSKWLLDGCDKILFCMKQYGLDPSEALKLFSGIPANTAITKAVETSLNLLKGIGTALSYVAVLNDLVEGTTKVKKLLDIYNMVPVPCKNDAAAAQKIKDDIATYIVEEVGWFGVLAIADLAGTEAMNKGALAIPIPPVGASVCAIMGGAIGTLVKAMANDLNGKIYEDNVRKYYERINALECDYDKWKQKVRVSWLAEQRYARNRMYGVPFKNVKVTVDPSGFVYEAVEDNRVENATATIYYRQTGEDEWGDLHDETVLWDATEYGQQNPLFTDADGRYAWDVPKGLWQVKIEKEGYETAYSDWLPVPPPQLEVNIGLRQNTLPDVKTARAYEDLVVLEFNKYMRNRTITKDNIRLTQGTTPLDYYLEPQDVGTAWKGEAHYVRRLYLRPQTPFTPGEKLTLTVSREVESYTGLQMQNDYQQEFTVVSEVRQLGVDSLVEVPLTGDRTFSVLAFPGAAAQGKRLIATIQTGYIASTVAIGEFDENGIARITLHGDNTGTSRLTLQLEGTDITTSTLLEVVGAESMPVATPTASRISGTSVMRGETVALYCDTEGATIWYTLDGTCPCDENGTRQRYTEPIAINSQTTLRAYAVKGDMQESRVATFEYYIIGANGLDSTTSSPSASAYYAPNGQRRQQPQRGINIVQYDDGTVRKVMRK